MTDLAERRAALRQSLLNGEVRITEIHNAGVVAIWSGEAEAGRELFRLAICLSPERVAAWQGLGEAARLCGLLTESAAAYSRAMRLKPDDQEIIYGRMLTADAAMDAVEIVRLGRRLDELGAPFARYAPMYVFALQAIGDYGAAQAAAERHLALGASASEHSAYLMGRHYVPGNSLEENLREHRRWAATHAPPPSTFTPPPFAPSADEPIRIGFVSPDLRFHPVGNFVSALFEFNDPAKFELYCFPCSTKQDRFTEYLKGFKSAWIDIQGKDDSEAAAIIRSVQPHVLFDLAGHTNGNRATLFARRLAPVQISWAGYVGTTGLPMMDYIVADPVYITQADAAFYTETPLLMEHCYASYLPVATGMAEMRWRAKPNDEILFGSFNNIMKINQDVISAWASILHEVGNSKLFLKYLWFDNAFIHEKILNMFKKYGVAADRLRIEGWSPQGEFVGRYNEIDISLDTFPYGGGLTTCEALYMGVPVVTLRCSSFAGRHAASYLTAAGCPELIAETQEEYIRIACALAADKERLGEYRLSLRDRMLRSPICDRSGFATELYGKIAAVVERFYADGGKMEKPLKEPAAFPK